MGTSQLEKLEITYLSLDGDPALLLKDSTGRVMSAYVSYNDGTTWQKASAAELCMNGRILSARTFQKTWPGINLPNDS
jgi:hypothetical protein